MKDYLTYTELLQDAKNPPADTTPEDKKMYDIIVAYDQSLLQENYGQAFAVVTQALTKKSLWQSSTAPIQILVLEQLLDPRSDETKIKVPSQDADFYNLLGLAYRDVGKLNRAVELVKKSSDMYVLLGKQKEATEALCDLVGPLRTYGQLIEATTTAYMALDQARKIVDENTKKYWEAVALRVLGFCLILIGDFDRAKTALDKALAYYHNEYKADRQGEGMVNAFLALYYLETGDLEKANECAELAWQFADDQKFERDYIRAAYMQALVALRRIPADLKKANEKVDFLVDKAENAGIAEHIANAYLAFAELALTEGRNSGAKSYLQDITIMPDLAYLKLAHIEAYIMYSATLLAENEIDEAMEIAFEQLDNCLALDTWYYPGAKRLMGLITAAGKELPQIPTPPELEFQVEI